MAIESYSTTFTLVLAGILTALVVHHVCSRSRLPSPPGPPGKWIIGNLNSIPPGMRPWIVYTKWRDNFGPIVYREIFSRPSIVLNTAEAVQDLLEARATIYSDRPHSWMYGELCGRKNEVFAMSYENPRFRMYRRLLHYGLNPRATQSYRAIQEEQKDIFLQSLRTSPEKFISHVRRNAGAVILDITYGHKVTSDDDYLVRRIEESFHFEETQMNKWFLVEVIPWLRFIPSWFPFASFRRIAQQYKAIDIVDEPYQKAKESIHEGQYVESFVSKLLDQDRDDTSKLSHEAKGMDMDDLIKWCSSALYIGGADTTVSAMTTFFYLMATHPEIQRKAQAEIDEVVGTDRLPTFDDRERLPYTLALIKEMSRWGPPVPKALEHRLTKDDEYMGYSIPKGCAVIPNIWGITHDATLYPNPTIFDPTRHLGESIQPNPFKYTFGFGRRVCPGQHFAEMSIFLNVTNILATFNIGKKPGKDLVADWGLGIISHLKPFECSIVPRNKIPYVLT